MIVETGFKGHSSEKILLNKVSECSDHFLGELNERGDVMCKLRHQSVAIRIAFEKSQ